MSAKRTTAWVAAAACLAAAATAPAAVPSIESFDYPDGSDLGGQNGGVGWAGAWGAVSGTWTLKTTAGSLTYPGLPSGGGKIHFSARR